MGCWGLRIRVAFLKHVRRAWTRKCVLGCLNSGSSGDHGFHANLAGSFDPRNLPEETCNSPQPRIAIAWNGRCPPIGRHCLTASGIRPRKPITAPHQSHAEGRYATHQPEPAGHESSGGVYSLHARVRRCAVIQGLWDRTMAFTAQPAWSENASRARRLGVSAMSVPKRMMQEPIHIQRTSGLRNALMIGRPLFWSRPS